MSDPYFRIDEAEVDYSVFVLQQHGKFSFRLASTRKDGRVGRKDAQALYSRR
jgi:hypothetical protein